VEAVLLYRIAYVHASVAHSVVRQLAACPEPGGQIALDAQTVVTVTKVTRHGDGDTIAAEVSAELRAVPAVTGSTSRSSR
jgi:hypothetical protein